MIIDFFKFLFFICFFAICSCYTKTEGCLDLDATNFNPTYDVNCCCGYPSLVLFTTSNWKVKPLRNDTFYVDAGGNKFKINSIKYYISNIRLVKEDDTEFRVQDTLNLNNNLSITDDYKILIANELQSTIGKIKLNGKLKSIKFSLGLDSNATNVNPTEITIGKGLAINKDSMYDFNKQMYIFNKISYTFDSIPQYISYGGLSTKIELNLPTNYQVIRGKNITLEMIVDYNKWFESIDFKKDNSMTQINKLLSNIGKSFSFK